MDGILLVDKPAGPTSHDVVDRARRILGENRIGHAGTLDPPAEGLLVLALGKALKVLEFMEQHDKEYEFVVRFGRVTDTDDAAGKILQERDPAGLDRARVEKEMERFRGVLMQVPPDFSSVRIGGRRLHRAARKGTPLEAPPRAVRVDRLELLEWTPPSARLHAVCSKGTYVRAIARDLGRALEVGACVERLRRLRSGPFHVRDAVTLNRPSTELEAALLPTDAGLAHLREIRISRERAEKFLLGQPVEIGAGAGGEGDEQIRVYAETDFLGVGRAKGNSLRPRKVVGALSPPAPGP